MGEWGKDPHPSGSRCALPGRKLRIWEFKEGGSVPGKIFLDEQIGIMFKPKKTFFLEMKIVCPLPGKI